MKTSKFISIMVFSIGLLSTLYSDLFAAAAPAAAGMPQRIWVSNPINPSFNPDACVYINLGREQIPMGFYVGAGETFDFNFRPLTPGHVGPEIMVASYPFKQDVTGTARFAPTNASTFLQVTAQPGAANAFNVWRITPYQIGAGVQERSQENTSSWLRRLQILTTHFDTWRQGKPTLSPAQRESVITVLNCFPRVVKKIENISKSSASKGAQLWSWFTEDKQIKSFNILGLEKSSAVYVRSGLRETTVSTALGLFKGAVNIARKQRGYGPENITTDYYAQYANAKEALAEAMILASNNIKHNIAANTRLSEGENAAVQALIDTARANLSTDTPNNQRQELAEQDIDVVEIILLHLAQHPEAH